VKWKNYEKLITYLLTIILIVLPFILVSCGCKHEKVTLKGKDATCYEDGLTDGEKCTLCGEILKEQTVIPKLTHNYVNGVCTICNMENPLESLKFEIGDDGSYYVIAGIGSYKSNTLVLPTEYNGKPVKNVGVEAFMGNDTLKKLIIPAGIDIGDRAFYNCKILDTLEILDSNTKFGIAAFMGCGDLENVSLPDNMKEITSNMFNGCVKLKKLELGNTIESIGDLAFAATGFETITIPDSVKTISNGAFWNAMSLKTINLGSGVETLGDYIFKNCTSLETVVIPDNVKTMGARLFDGCHGLKEVTVGNGIEKIGVQTFKNCSGLEKLTLGKNVKSIGSGAFYGCMRITEVYVASLENWNNISDRGDLDVYCYGYKVYYNGTQVN
jgi:hypothetical protein